MGLVTKTIISESPDMTYRLALSLGEKVIPGAVIAAGGNLGAGKTLFAAGFARGLGVTEPVTSPTYIFFREYSAKHTFCHVDAYRLEGLSEEEIALTGIEDCFAARKVAYVEWPEFIAGWLPPNTVRLNIRVLAPDKRELCFIYDKGEEWLHAIIGD